MSNKMDMGQLYTASSNLIDFGKESCERREEKHWCYNCDTALRVTYMEDRVYLVTCPQCEVVHLTRAASPGEALGKIGHQFGGKKSE